MTMAISRSSMLSGVIAAAFLFSAGAGLIASEAPSVTAPGNAIPDFSSNGKTKIFQTAVWNNKQVVVRARSTASPTRVTRF
jgi:hypothetical protein